MEAIHSAKDPVWKLNKFKLLWTHINLIHSFIHAVLNFFIWKSTNVQCVTSRKTAQKLFFLSITHSVCKSTIQFVLLFYFTALPLYDFVIVVGFFCGVAAVTAVLFRLFWLQLLMQPNLHRCFCAQSQWIDQTAPKRMKFQTNTCMKQPDET